MTLKSFNLWVIYWIKTLKHPMVSFFFHPGDFKRDLSEFWLFCSYRCYNKRQGKKLRPVWRQNTLRKRVKFAPKNSIYSQYFGLNSQCKACSFSVCNRMKHTFSVHRVSSKNSWNLTANTEDIYAWPRKADQFAVVTARPELGTWSIIIETFYVVKYASHVWRSGRMLAGLA